MDNKKSEPLAGLSFGYLLRIQDAIADQLDHLKYCWEQSHGASSEGKVPVIFLGERYTVFAGGYTPEEIKDAIERIQAGRKEKADKKLVGETVLNDACVQPGTIQSEKLGNATISSSYSIRVNDSESEKRRVAGMISFKGSLFRAQAVATRVELSDDMREAVVDAVRNSDLFVSLRAEMIGQAASIDSLKSAVHDAIRNATQPGGLLYGKR
ncbi:hypothetical protein [Leclercia adecarboxylata]|uniref:DUF1983 domain-containing protein n=1 Tax=Leclercia adecarboxylata TaxID=83655 RepID=A0ABU6I9K3_9ENTR|nr:hypothetical protein [Leclercia adecarboxylata]MBZ3803266.1 hypothetical protein [Leclercia adecarboxylata]MBZ3807997.1 hypothetical protein [Leclercia adecarboxylata]MEC3938276.1 hypothetical protein [Leclercia adecarboxylata]QEY54912.1 hypothetical protein FTX45_08710 [Leclercia adecarboxylata]